MTTTAHLNRTVTAIKNLAANGELRKVVHLEQDWIGNIYAKYKGLRTAVIVASFVYCERHIATKALENAGYIVHPVRRGLGNRKIWIRPSNEVYIEEHAKNFKAIRGKISLRSLKKS